MVFPFMLKAIFLSVYTGKTENLFWKDNGSSNKQKKIGSSCRVVGDATFVEGGLS